MDEEFVECSFLVPLVANSTRKPHSASVWQALERVLYETFGGSTGPELLYRSLSSTPGAYKDDDGQFTPDESQRYIVALRREEIDKLRAILRKVANSFDQESIYFCKPGSTVEFVRAEENVGFLD